MTQKKGPLYAMASGNFAVGIGALVVAGVLQPLADTFTVWLSTVGRLVTAVGAATFTPVASAVAARISPPAERGRAIALVFAGFTAATALGVPFGTYLGLVVGWRLTFAAVALLAVTLVQMAAQLSVFTYVAPYVQERVAVGAVGITLLFLANGAAGFAGNLGGGRLADRIGSGRTIALFLAVLVAALAVLPVVGRSLLLGAVAIAVWGYVGLGFNAPQQAHLVGLAPELTNAVLALNASFLYLGISLGSFLGGQVVDAGQIRNLHWLAVGLALTAAVIFAVTRARFRVAKTGGRP